MKQKKTNVTTTYVVLDKQDFLCFYVKATARKVCTKILKFIDLKVMSRQDI